MSYKLKKDLDGNLTMIIRDEGNVCIPIDPGNREYRKYLAWVEAGNMPIPADEPEPVVIPPSSNERIEALETMLSMVLDQEAGL